MRGRGALSTIWGPSQGQNSERGRPGGGPGAPGAFFKKSNRQSGKHFLKRSGSEENHREDKGDSLNVGERGLLHGTG